MNNPFARMKVERKTEAGAVGPTNEDADSNVLSLSITVFGYPSSEPSGEISSDPLAMTLGPKFTLSYLEDLEYPAVFAGHIEENRISVLELCNVLNALREDNFGYMVDFDTYNQRRPNVFQYTQIWFSSPIDTPKVAGSGKSLCELIAKLIKGETVEGLLPGFGNSRSSIMESHVAFLRERTKGGLRDLDHFLGGV